MTNLFTALEMTAQEIKDSEGKEYNPSTWNQIINRYASYKGIRFFQVAPGNGYSYYRYFASYSTPEGLNFFTSVCYSSCLSNSGFSIISIQPTEVEKQFEIVHFLFTVNGKQIRAANVPSNRKALAMRARTYGEIYTNEF